MFFHMAKGRRLTTSLSERYLGTYPTGHSHTHAALPSDEPEFYEEDLWSTVAGDNSAQFHYYENGHASASEWESRASETQRIGVSGGLSLAFQDTASLHQRPRQRHMATSAPMNVPDWSNILRVDSAVNSEDSEVDPPHVYLARGRKTGAKSVFEGVGRTLKGRDMSRLRDAVWSQTGFDG